MTGDSQALHYITTHGCCCCAVADKSVLTRRPRGRIWFRRLSKSFVNRSPKAQFRAGLCYVRSRLISHGQITKSNDKRCEMKDCSNEGATNWINCDVCGRWLHYKRAGVRRRPKAAFVCTDCTEHYQLNYDRRAQDLSE